MFRYKIFYPLLILLALHINFHAFTQSASFPYNDWVEKLGPPNDTRYFNQQFGLSLKAYCKILRFQASLPHIKKGELYPQLNFTDQSHFIKEIKQFSGVSPKELHKNKNDRFLQFLVYD